MAFSVTPTSGGGPYTYEAEISDKSHFDSGLFKLEFANHTSASACSTNPTGGSLSEEAALSLLASGQYIRTATAPSSNCLTSVLRVINVSSGNIENYMLAYIDRIE